MASRIKGLSCAPRCVIELYGLSHNNGELLQADDCRDSWFVKAAAETSGRSARRALSSCISWEAAERVYEAVDIIERRQRRHMRSRSMSMLCVQKEQCRKQIGRQYEQ